MARYCRKEGNYISNISEEQLRNPLSSKLDALRTVGTRVIAGEPLPAIIRDYPEHLINYTRLV